MIYRKLYISGFIISLFFAYVQSSFAQVKTYAWDQVNLPTYSWDQFTPLGPDLALDVNYDSSSITIVGDKLKFELNSSQVTPPRTSESFNFRSEIRTHPWNIQHPLRTEQWIGWRYVLGASYQVDTIAPITIYQSHPGIQGSPPTVEIELAAALRPYPALGGELQIVNHVSFERKILPIRPQAGDSLEIVVHLIHGDEHEGLFQVWINGVIQYDRQERTIFSDYPWGGNSKWGIYHHDHKNNPISVQASLNQGISSVEIYMDTLRMLTRSPIAPDYKSFSYSDVESKGGISVPPFNGTTCMSPNTNEWRHIDIGSVNIDGDVCQDGDAFSLLASGSGIGLMHDEFHFMFQKLSRDGEIKARILSIGDTETGANAGIMIRKDFSDDAPFIRIGGTHWAEILSTARLNPGATSFAYRSDILAITYPIWMKLTRTGEKIVSSISYDADSWQKVDSSFLLHYQDVLVGIASASTNPNVLNEAIVDQIEVSGTLQPFPIELIDFNAEPYDGYPYVILTWFTAQEINNDYFTLERSRDGSLFIPFGQISSQGNGNKLQNYSYLDREALAGINYYRLKQTDIDGTFSYSKVLEIEINADEPEFLNLWPNSVKAGSSVRVDTEQITEKDYVLVLRDLLGRTWKIPFIANSDKKIEFKTHKFSPGIYAIFLQFADGSYRPFQKLSIE